MGVYSTLTVKRTTALAALAQAQHGDLTDEQLGDILDQYTKSSLYNVMVTSSGGDDATLADVMGLDLES